jgi:DNA-binding transcriptional MerR regulator
MGWSLEELVRRVAQALAAGSVRSPSGRVTQLPDRRVIRWYATIGLVDRPLSSQGRAARYGPRHLLQLVAIKRRQAEGQALADIQVELAGATDATLQRIAQVRPPLLDPTVSAVDRPAEAHTEAVDPTPLIARTGDAVDLRPDSLDLRPQPVERSRMPAARVERRFWGRSDPVTLNLDDYVHGTPLGGALLLLPVPPGPDDVLAIRAAAQPLLDLLVHRGLVPGGSPA